MPDELFASLRMLALSEPRKMLVMNGTVEIPLAGEPALPFAVTLLIPSPVALLLGCKFLGVIHARLAG